MNNYHECQCNCPTEEMHWDYMAMQLDEQKYYLTEWDLDYLGAEWLTQPMAIPRS